jgi:hypothetical protein
MPKIIALPEQRLALVAGQGVAEAVAEVQLGGISGLSTAAEAGLAADPAVALFRSRSKAFLAAMVTASVKDTPFNAASSRISLQVSSFPMYRLLGVLAINYLIGRFRNLDHGRAR